MKRKQKIALAICAIVVAIIAILASWYFSPKTFLKGVEPADVDPKDVELMVVPGGNIAEIDKPEVWEFLTQVQRHDGLIAGICAGVDVLDHAGILEGIESTHSTELDVAVTDRVITSRANGYVDFAIEVAKKMNLFKDEADLQETIAFWRDYQRMQ